MLGILQTDAVSGLLKLHLQQSQAVLRCQVFQAKRMFECLPPLLPAGRLQGSREWPFSNSEQSLKAPRSLTRSGGALPSPAGAPLVCNRCCVTAASCHVGLTQARHKAQPLLGQRATSL